MQAIIFLKQYGFFLQLLAPFLILMFNGKKRKYFPLRLIAVLFVTSPLYFMNTVKFHLINYAYILSDLILFLLSFFLYEEKPFVLLFTAIASFGLQHIIWNDFFLLYENIRPMQNLNAIWLNVIFILNLLVSYLLVFFLIFKTKLKIIYRPRQWPSFILSLIVILIVIFMAQLVPYVQNGWNFLVRLYSNISILLCLIIQFGYPYVYDVIQKDKKLLDEKKELENLLYLQAKQERLGKEATDIMNLRIHDMKNQLNSLKYLHGKDRIDSIEELEKNIDIYSSIAKTGNEALDIVLTQKGLICLSKKITFTYIIDGKALSFMSPTDITSLFGNIIDNAIESAEREKDDFRLIKIISDKKKNFLEIQESNYCHRELVFRNGIPVSGKKDKKLHGFGLKSISYIIEKYHGQMNVSQENGIFRLYLLIPIDVSSSD